MALNTGHGSVSRPSSFLSERAYLTNNVDLLSEGDGPVDNGDVECFHHYNQPVYGVLESLHTIQKVILVSHSMGCTTVARACERYSPRIHAAVYIVGAMHKSGM